MVIGDASPAYSIVIIPIVILRIGLTAGWKPPPAYPIFAAVAFSCSGLANVLLFIATRHSFIQQAAEVRPRVQVTTQRVTVLEDAQGVQTFHLHEISDTAQPEGQDDASEKSDLERDGSFQLKRKAPAAEGGVGRPTTGVRFLANE
ncbi:hypothetical protein FRC08_017611 [Ceratobasidium sp. 394]|nr:hypothetical protein FRC08_017611 [Ceratobasidium sp. 394]